MRKPNEKKKKKEREITSFAATALPEEKRSRERREPVIDLTVLARFDIE